LSVLLLAKALRAARDALRRPLTLRARVDRGDSGMKVLREWFWSRTSGEGITGERLPLVELSEKRECPGGETRRSIERDSE